jgi:hypothetical protein
MPKKTINDNLRKVIQLTYEMLELADHGDKFRQDSGCGVVYGTLRDEAYKIRKLAEEELLKHSGKHKGTSQKAPGKIAEENQKPLAAQ